jgi:hypothetical protein
MQSSIAEKIETIDEQTFSLTSPAQVISLHLSVRERMSQWIQKRFPQEKREEMAGITFILASFFLTGWFYYALYQAVQSYGTF